MSYFFTSSISKVYFVNPNRVQLVLIHPILGSVYEIDFAYYRWRVVRRHIAYYRWRVVRRHTEYKTLFVRWKASFMAMAAEQDMFVQVYWRGISVLAMNICGIMLGSAMTITVALSREEIIVTYLCGLNLEMYNLDMKRPLVRAASSSPSSRLVRTMASSTCFE